MRPTLRYRKVGGPWRSDCAGAVHGVESLNGASQRANDREHHALAGLAAGFAPLARKKAVTAPP